MFEVLQRVTSTWQKEKFKPNGVVITLTCLDPTISDKLAELKDRLIHFLLIERSSQRRVCASKTTRVQTRDEFWFQFLNHLKE